MRSDGRMKGKQRVGPHFAETTSTTASSCSNVSRNIHTLSSAVFSSPSPPQPPLPYRLCLLCVCVWWSQRDRLNTILGDNGLLLQDHKTQLPAIRLYSTQCFQGENNAYISLYVSLLPSPSTSSPRMQLSPFFSPCFVTWRDYSILPFLNN